MAAIEPKLRHLGLRLVDERQIFWIGILGPMRDHAGEFEARRGLGLRIGRERKNSD
ncbi:hypothetical protein D3C83_259040 [compost metagenome]